MPLSDVYSVQIENTAYCNRRCAWCPQSSMAFSQDDRMPVPVMEKIVSELSRLKYHGRIHPYGNGEPLTDLDFLDRARYIKGHLPSCLVWVSTNGDLIDKTVSFEQLFASGVDAVQVNHYDFANRHLERCKDPRVDHVHMSFLRSTFYNRAGNVCVASATPVEQCWWPGRKLFFDYQGNFLVCCSDWKKEDVVGNIMEQPLAVLLEDAKMQRYKKLLSEGRQDELLLCSKCNMIKRRRLEDVHHSKNRIRGMSEERTAAAC